MSFVPTVVVATRHGVVRPAKLLGFGTERLETNVVEVVDVVTDVEVSRPHRLRFEQRAQRRHGSVVQVRRARNRWTSASPRTGRQTSSTYSRHAALSGFAG